ncbi:hypothetical protein BA062_03310 [Prauserella flavalba]|uniref:Secreted protein n=1 Tax=Prauserella flavalba TaxID=1477506 RepID=A0A318M4G1_9PSEU|nr:hypothetical protein BA062_03310 [Prauserella flavalba]
MRGIAGAALSTTLILTVFVGPALAQDEEAGTSTDVAVTTTTAPPETTTSESAPETSTSESAPETTTSESDSATTTTSAEPTATETSESEETSTTTTSSEPTGPEEPPYVDDSGYGIDLDPEQGLGLLLIACAAGEPTGVTSPDFEILDGPWQDETDGRYWAYLVQLQPGLTFAGGNVVADWVCGGEPGGGSGSGGGGSTPVAPVPGSEDAGDWQRENGGDAQVGFAPKGGVETGAGGIARG